MVARLEEPARLGCRLAAQVGDFVCQKLGVALFVRNLGLEQAAQLPAVGPRQLGRIVRIHHDGLIFTGQIVIEAVDEFLPSDGLRRIVRAIPFAGLCLAVFLNLCSAILMDSRLVRVHDRFNTASAFGDP